MSPWVVRRVVRRMRLVVGSLVHHPSWEVAPGAAHSLEEVLGCKALGLVERHILVVVMVRGDTRLGAEEMAHGVLWVVAGRVRRSSPAAEGVGRIGPGEDSGLVAEGPGVHRIAAEGREVVVGRRSGDNLGEEPRRVVLDHARQLDLSICGAGVVGYSRDGG
jgi:hypothetical protein